MNPDIAQLFQSLTNLLNSDPEAAVRMAREIVATGPTRWNLLSVRAAMLIDGGVLARDSEAIAEGRAAWCEIYDEFPTAEVAYNLANSLVATAVEPPRDVTWLDHKESTRDARAEARRLYWKAIHEPAPDPSRVTQALTNIATQLGACYRFGEAHDARLAALQIDPQNGVAACAAAQALHWLYHNVDCSDLTRLEAGMLATIATRHPERLSEYAGAQAGREMLEFAQQFDAPPPRKPHSDPFVSWIERERLTLSPSVELVDPELGKVDWLMLPTIRERDKSHGTKPPPIFAMFNVLKADFILARDLAWRAIGDSNWPETGRFSETLDHAAYGPDSSALVLAHRTVLDLLDKVAVITNLHFKLGVAPDKVYFGRMWRVPPNKASTARPLLPAVEAAIRNGASALYGLVELADDYESKDGILRSHKDLRNAGTHRFIVLHDYWEPAQFREASELEHISRKDFMQELLKAMRVARSAIQTFTLAVAQHERYGDDSEGLVANLIVGDHHRLRS